MPTRQVEQKTFETGEIGDNHLFRADLAVRDKSVRRARNVRIRVSGSLEARPGMRRIATLPGDGYVREMTIQETTFILVLTHQQLQVFDKATRVSVQTITGCAWTLAMMTDDTTPLVVAPYNDEARVFHPTMPEQIIKRGETGSWSVAADTPAIGSAGSKRQAYYRFAERSVSLTPSPAGGAMINLVASAPYFVAGHVGVRFRLQGREIEIASVTDATHATANLIQQLYPTVSLPVASTIGFDVGDVIEGRDTQTKGEIVAVGSGSLTVLMQSFTPWFFDSGATPTGEQVLGPNATTRVSGAQAPATDAPVLNFDEQAESLVRGYAATGAVHRNRLWKARLPRVPFGVLASTIGDFQDFLVGTGDNDAIFEELGDTRAGVVRHVLSAEQMLIGTSSGLYYVPESETNPIRPTSFSVNQIGPDGVSACRPVLISEGAFFVGAGGGSIIGVFPTGDVRRSWKTADVSLLSSHLILRPRGLAYIGDDDRDPERYVYGVNTDGTMPVVYYSETAEVFGWTKWETQGQVRSICAHQGECWALVQRQHGPTPRFSLEVFEDDLHVDGAVNVDRVADYRGPATGQVISGPDGEVPATFVYRAAALSNATVSLMIGGAYIGEVTLDSAGDFGAPDVDGDIVLGWNFVPLVELWPPQDGEDQRALRRRQRIVQIMTRWRGRYLAVNGKLRPPYRGGENTAQAPALRDELDRVPMFGWSDEPTVTVSRPYPGPWSLLGVIQLVKN
ncbi:hypothetical protein [Brevundimonas diminuta]|uniref:hypothetical protein n=1 Tax=Brevundimonas diminuta TaxID=293 RepID=UPI003D9A2B82